MSPSVLAAPTTPAPRRITDIVEARRAGAGVVVEICFDILPVDFQHGSVPFQAYIFLARYQGTIDGDPFAFRKCYARGCPNNLCTHVSLAVTIANRYLQRDYQQLRSAGIALEEHLFSLDQMVVKFEQLKQADITVLTISDLVEMARAGKTVGLDLALECIPAVEHFANQKAAQTFLTGEFNARCEDKLYCCDRCLACYATDKAQEEKPPAVQIANARLALIYAEFRQVAIGFEERYFH